MNSYNDIKLGMKCFLFTLEQYELNKLNVYKHRYLIPQEVFHITLHDNNFKTLFISYHIQNNI
jgi:hypothetical protein